MSTINERVAKSRELLKLKPAEFARKLDNRLQRIQDVERDKQRAPVELLASIVEVFDIDGTWLLTGRGSPIRGEGDVNCVREPSAEYTSEEKFKRLQHVRSVIPKLAILQNRKLSPFQIQAVADISYLFEINDEQIKLLLTLFDYCE